MNKPEGSYRCTVCGAKWDGRQLLQDPLNTAVRWTCGYAVCGGLVVKIVPCAYCGDDRTGKGSLIINDLIFCNEDHFELWHAAIREKQDEN